MSGLLGAWALNSLPVGDRLTPTERRAMLAQLYDAPSNLNGRFGQHEAGPLWLCAARDKLDVGRHTVIAFEGFLAGRDSGATTENLASLHQSSPQSLEGHFVLVRADERGELQLTRSPSGGERLYTAQLDDLLLFSTSLRALLALGRLQRRLDPRVAGESLVAGVNAFGTGTLVAGIDEVMPAHTQTVGRQPQPQVCLWRSQLRSLEGDPETLARGFRDALTAAVAGAGGRARPVAVALSGGIDSSAVAAAAVDAFGADQIEAISYEFDDPEHPSETRYAEMVCRRLGIRRHHVFKVTRDSYLQAIPEAVWRSESLVHWPKAFLLPVARHLRERGHDRYLTGFGVGSHMTYLHELSQLFRVPGGSRLFRRWTERALDSDGAWTLLSRAHPGLEPPHRRLYYMLVCMLAHYGLVRDVESYFPPSLRPLLIEHRGGAYPTPDSPAATLVESLQMQAFSHHLACIDVTRSEKSSREVGCLRISPAHFASCIPYALFPTLPQPALTDGARRQRPGKQLLQLAYRSVLPHEVLFRTKSWADAVASPSWIREGRRLMLRALPDFPHSLGSIARDYPDAVRFWEPHSIHSTGLALAFWRHIMVDAPTMRAPTWIGLLGREAA